MREVMEENVVWHLLLSGLGVSLLQRFACSKTSEVVLLDVQRRMHPTIAEFPNCHFYQGKLKNSGVNFFDQVNSSFLRCQ